MKSSNLNKYLDLGNDWENNVAYLEESKQSKALAGKCDSFHTVNSWWVWGSASQPQKQFGFYILICLEKVFPALQLRQHFYLHYNIYLFFFFFFFKNGNLVINWLFATPRYTERLSSPSDKTWRQGDFKNPNFHTL